MAGQRGWICGEQHHALSRDWVLEGHDLETFIAAPAAIAMRRSEYNKEERRYSVNEQISALRLARLMESVAPRPDPGAKRMVTGKGMYLVAGSAAFTGARVVRTRTVAWSSLSSKVDRT